jgi:hypothetical protein
VSNHTAVVLGWHDCWCSVAEFLQTPDRDVEAPHAASYSSAGDEYKASKADIIR